MELNELIFKIIFVIAVFAVFGPLDDWAETSTSWQPS